MSLIKCSKRLFVVLFLVSSSYTVLARKGVDFEARASIYRDAYRNYYALGPNLILNFNERIGLRIHLGRVFIWSDEVEIDHIFSAVVTSPHDGLFSLMVYFPRGKITPYGTLWFDPVILSNEGTFLEGKIGFGLEYGLNDKFAVFAESGIFLDFGSDEGVYDALRLSVGARLF
jgi:hypothetical protein